MCRDALLHRSHEIQPAFFDSEIKNFSFIGNFSVSSFFFIYQETGVWHLQGPSRGGLFGLCTNFVILGAGMGAPIAGSSPGLVQILETSADQVIKIFESNLGIQHLTFGN